MPDKYQETCPAQLRVANSDRQLLEVTIAQPGPTKHHRPIVYSPEVLAATVDKWPGAAMFLGHGWLWQDGDPSDLAGVYMHATYDTEANALRALVRMTDPQAFRLAEQVINDREAGLPVPDVGISAVWTLTAQLGPDDNYHATAIHHIYSGDIVFMPAAGGVLERVLHSAGYHPTIPAPATGPTVEQLLAQLSQAQEQAQAAAATIQDLDGRLHAAHAELLMLATRFYPGMESVLTGDTVETLAQQIRIADAAIAAAAAARPAGAPAGAPVRSGPSLDGLSATEKIKLGLAGR